MVPKIINYTVQPCPLPFNFLLFQCRLNNKNNSIQVCKLVLHNSDNVMTIQIFRFNELSLSSLPLLNLICFFLFLINIANRIKDIQSMAVILLVTLFISCIHLCSQQQQIPFQVYNHSLSRPYTLSYAQQGQKLTSVFTLYGEEPTLYGFNIAFLEDYPYNTSNIQFIVSMRNILNYSVVVNLTGYYISYLKFIYSDNITLVKSSIFLNDRKVAERYEALYRWTTPLFEFTTNRVCRAKINWNRKVGYPVKFYRPGNPPFNNNSSFKFLNSTPQYYQFEVNETGKWFIAIQQGDLPFGYLEKIVLNLTTFSDSPCQNECSKLGYPVVGLVPDTSDVCICDQTKINLFWNPEQKVCEDCRFGKCIKFPFPNKCGNKIKEGTQKCDNGNQTGCIECNIDPNYTCEEDENNYSLCIHKLNQIEQESSSINVIIIIALVIGVLPNLAMAICVIALCVRYRKLKKERQLERVNNAEKEKKMGMKNQMQNTKIRGSQQYKIYTELVNSNTTETNKVMIVENI